MFTQALSLSHASYSRPRSTMALYFPLFRALPFFKEIRDEVFVEHVALPENGLDGKGWKFRMLATVGGRSEVEFSDTTPLATSKVVEQISIKECPTSPKPGHNIGSIGRRTRRRGLWRWTRKRRSRRRGRQRRPRSRLARAPLTPTTTRTTRGGIRCCDCRDENVRRRDHGARRV